MWVLSSRWSATLAPSMVAQGRVRVAAAYVSVLVTLVQQQQQQQQLHVRQPAKLDLRLWFRVARRTRWRWGCRTASRSCSRLAGTAGVSAAWVVAMRLWSEPMIVVAPSQPLVGPGPLAVAAGSDSAALLTDATGRSGKSFVVY